jgi:hypothetical protein
MMMATEVSFTISERALKMWILWIDETLLTICLYGKIASLVNNAFRSAPRKPVVTWIIEQG